MKTNLLKISILTLFFALLLGCQKDDESQMQDDTPETAMYRATFNATWSASSHPTDFPSNDHFSGLIGMTHHTSSKLYEVGTLASTGIKNMAETGSKNALTSEINALIEAGTAASLISGGGLGSGTGSVSVTFEVNQSHSLFSIVSMIAPSPDWFVGVSGVELFENGAWLTEKTINVGVYDSGTDSGLTFSAANAPTSPPEAIFEIMTAPLAQGGTVPSMGTITLERLP